MGKLIYVTGGARSGKSSFAEKKVISLEKEKIYLATSIPFDDEMRDRIKKHQLQRENLNWKTVEGYKKIANLLENYKEKDVVVLLDCLTNLVSNNMILEKEIDWDQISPEEVNEIEKKIEKEVKETIEFIKKNRLDMVIVSNEIGMGLVPPYALGRYFRDICGRMNQLVAKESDEAYLIVSGLEVKIK